jgi:hypothetical protein
VICIGVLVMWCNAAQPLNSFCLVYQPVVQAKGDGSIPATPGAKRRILANELFYRKNCK